MAFHLVARHGFKYGRVRLVDKCGQVRWGEAKDHALVEQAGEEIAVHKGAGIAEHFLDLNIRPGGDCLVKQADQIGG